MSTDLDRALSELAHHLDEVAPSIGVDEIVGAAQRVEPPLRLALTPPGRLRHHGPRESTRRPWLSAAAIGITLAGVAAVWAAVDAAPNRSRGTQPSAEATIPAPAAANGALLLDPVPAGWTIERVSAGSIGRSLPMSTRVYASDSLTPESAPALMVDVIDNDAGRPDIPADAEPIEVLGVAGSLYRRGPGLAVSFETGGFWIDVTGYQLGREELLRAVEHTRLDGASAVIDPAGLPDGVAERGFGGRFEAWFIDQIAATVATPMMHWQSGSAQSLWLLAIPGTPAQAALGRIGADTVTDVTVNGNPGFVTAIARDAEYRSLTWAAGGHVYRLGSRSLDDDQLVDFATAMRPASQAAWDQAVATAAPPIASIPAGGGLPAPQSVVPHRVTVFPVIDESLVPDDGAGPTYAYSTYTPAGIEIDGRRWIGAVGPDGWTDPGDVVSIAVADPELAEPTTGEPVRDPDVLESAQEASTRLTTTVDGMVVDVTGADVDVLYDVIAAIRPMLADSDLVGYTVDGLPAGFVDLTGPVATGWEAGAFPTVQVHRDALTMQVRPEPAIALIGAGGAATETVDVAGRTGYLFTSPDSGYRTLSIEIDERTSLRVASMKLTRDQFLDAAGRIELVDEATWQATYQPEAAVIPTIEPAPATTVQLPAD